MQLQSGDGNVTRERSTSGTAVKDTRQVFEKRRTSRRDLNESADVAATTHPPEATQEVAENEGGSNHKVLDTKLGLTLVVIA